MVAPALFASLFLALSAQPAPQDPGGAWMGVSLSEGDNPAAPGLEIVDVFKGSPAADAGMRAGDRLMSIEGHPVVSYEDLTGRLRRDHPGAQRQVWVRRNVDVQLDSDHMHQGRPLLGVMLGEGAYEGMVSITEVTPNSPAAHAGLLAGDQIRCLDDERTPSIEHFIDYMAGYDSGGRVVARISRSLDVVLGHRPQGTQPAHGAREPQHEPKAEPRAEPFGSHSNRGRVEDRLQAIEEARERMRDGGGATRLRERTPRAEGTWQRREPQRFELDRHPRQASAATLQAELRELAEGLQALRSEMAELRFELEALRDRR